MSRFTEGLRVSLKKSGRKGRPAAGTGSLQAEPIVVQREPESQATKVCSAPWDSRTVPQHGDSVPAPGHLSPSQLALLASLLQLAVALGMDLWRVAQALVGCFSLPF